ncbi:hypothetical protein [Methylobacterium fujisawaense]|uniref:hypothetical protein n=1 Tax=Methylobacterium fujisawaense TaxID=107400 RepID=UPI00313E28ED
MALIYFSRTRPPHPMQARPLISGVIEAEDVDAARAKLGATLGGANPGRCFMTADEFAFTDLASVTFRFNDILAVTTLEG